MNASVNLAAAGMAAETPVQNSPTKVAGVIAKLPPGPGSRRKVKVLTRVASMVACLALGALAGYGGMTYGINRLFVPVPGAKAWSLLCLAALPVIWLLVTAVHEAGHLVGGWLGGGRFLLWCVGPVMVRRTPAGIHVSWNRSVNVAGGMAACAPLETARMTPGRMAMMIAGGPVASGWLTATMLGLASWLIDWENPFSKGHAILQNIAILTSLLSFLIFLVTVVPMAVGGFKTDGRRIIDLLRGDRRSEQEVAMLMLTTASLAGLRPADYNPALVAKASSLGDGSLFDLYGQLTVYYHAADRGDWLGAQAHLDRTVAGMDQIVPFVRDVVRCEYAWLLATQSGDAACARAWLETAGKLELEPATRLRAEAAVLLAEGKAREAKEAATRGMEALEKKSLSPVKSPFAADALAALIGRSGMVAAAG